MDIGQLVRARGHEARINTIRRDGTFDLVRRADNGQVIEMNGIDKAEIELVKQDPTTPIQHGLTAGNGSPPPPQAPPPRGDVAPPSGDPATVVPAEHPRAVPTPRGRGRAKS